MGAGEYGLDILLRVQAGVDHTGGRVEEAGGGTLVDVADRAPLGVGQLPDVGARTDESVGDVTRLVALLLDAAPQRLELCAGLGGTDVGERGTDGHVSLAGDERLDDGGVVGGRGELDLLASLLGDDLHEQLELGDQGGGLLGGHTGDGDDAVVAAVSVGGGGGGLVGGIAAGGQSEAAHDESSGGGREATAQGREDHGFLLRLGERHARLL